MSKDQISLQAACQTPVDFPASFAQLINHSIGHDIDIDLPYLAHITSLLFLISV
jgi:hypothetical protein